MELNLLFKVNKDILVDDEFLNSCIRRTQSRETIQKDEKERDVIN